MPEAFAFRPDGKIVMVGHYEHYNEDFTMIEPATLVVAQLKLGRVYRHCIWH